VRNPARMACATALLVLMAGCATTGYAPTPFWSIREAAFKELKPGTTTKEDVRRQIGIPLTESHFPRQNEDVWEYRYLEGATIRMLADVYFDANGIYRGTTQRLDPAFNGGGLR
jgi:outer membrane protein assembly factor BamE (lipoprotein component of BamABCDE complex)